MGLYKKVWRGVGEWKSLRVCDFVCDFHIWEGDPSRHISLEWKGYSRTWPFGHVRFWAGSRQTFGKIVVEQVAQKHPCVGCEDEMSMEQS